jgi:hypothetical protein
VADVENKDAVVDDDVENTVGPALAFAVKQFVDGFAKGMRLWRKRCTVGEFGERLNLFSAPAIHLRAARGVPRLRI